MCSPVCSVFSMHLVTCNPPVLRARVLLEWGQRCAKELLRAAEAHGPASNVLVRTHEALQKHWRAKPCNWSPAAARGKVSEGSGRPVASAGRPCGAVQWLQGALRSGTCRMLRHGRVQCHSTECPWTKTESRAENKTYPCDHWHSILNAV